MSSRLAFQTQLASIMEVLANAAVAEICKLVDDDYAVVSLQMSQCQRENKALKRKVHLLELKMARGNAERRLRESAMNNGRPRVLISTSDRIRESSSDGVFAQQMDVSLWSGRAAAEDTTSKRIHSGIIQSKSPDVELVEPGEVLVKEEKVEANTPQVEEMEEEMVLIGDDGVVESVPCAAVGQRSRPEQQDSQSTTSLSQSQIQPQSQSCRTKYTTSSRGVEKEEPDVVLVKVEEVEPPMGTQTCLSIQEGLVESSTDDYRAILPFDEAAQSSTNQPSDLQESGQGFSEYAAPQSIPVTSQDPSSMVAVQLRVPDTNKPASPNIQQQQRSSNRNPLSAEYSLFELETLFTRWAPDNDSVSAPGGSLCSIPTGDPAECDQDGVIIVETEHSPQHALQPPEVSAVRSGGPSFSSGSDRSRAHIQPSVSQGMAVSIPLRMQTPSSQPTWNRSSAMIRSAQTQLLLQQHSKTIPPEQARLASASATVNHTDITEKTTISRISSTRTMSSTMAPQSALPGRETTAAFSRTETTTAQNHARLLANQNKINCASIVPGERQRKSYICRTCGKAFSGLSNLEAHERVHTGEKPFCCNTCGKRFSEAGNLKKHQRVHTGEKPFGCQQCGKRFAWICNLRTHQQSATGCGPQASGGLGLS